ncbi:MAG: hypothetical protein IJC39_00125, partial [Firmicutes bacterium]|nr:hypothetical protein [Bacillota bacterium]
LMVLTERSIFEEVCSSIQSESMQDIFAPMAEDYIVLAGIKIKRLGLEYQIEDVEKISPNRLAYSVAALKAYERIKGYYPAKDAGLGKINKKEQMQPNIVEDRNISKYMASGVVDIPIGLNASAGSIFFSDEIMHGLGRGAVGVTVAVEMYKDSGAALTPLSETIWGKMDIFDDKRRRNAINVETAVKVMYDRGTFMIGIRLLSWTDAISVSLRWTAFKAVDMEKRFLPFESKSASLTLVPDTIVLTPGETAVFQTVFTGMESGPCTFELVDDVGGTIDMNGEYVASAKEGVYEIRAVSVENPSVSASAFALVKQKKVKDVPGGKAKPFGF